MTEFEVGEAEEGLETGGGRRERTELVKRAILESNKL